MIGSKNHRVKESQLARPATKKKTHTLSRKKKPIEKQII